MNWVKTSWGSNWEKKIVGEVKNKLGKTLKYRMCDKLDWDTATWGGPQISTE